MKLRVIFNPRSGRNGRNARLGPLLKEFISAKKLDAVLAVTEGPGHATQLARDAVQSGCLRVVAVGGDGTMNEVAQALLHTPAALALVPCGSGNGLARHIGIPLTPLQSLSLASGTESGIAAIDTGVANGKPFFNAMGVGLDADVSRRFNQLTSRGLQAYAHTAWSAFRDRKAIAFKIKSGSEEHSIDALLISVANSAQYGNNAIIAPGAEVNDGILNLIAIRPVSLPGALILASRLFLGSIDRSTQVRHLRGERFTISRPSPGPFHTDGEVHDAGTSVEVAVDPRSLRIVVPSGCRLIQAIPEPPRPALSYST